MGHPVLDAGIAVDFGVSVGTEEIGRVLGTDSQLAEADDNIPLGIGFGDAEVVLESLRVHGGNGVRQDGGGHVDTSGYHSVSLQFSRVPDVQQYGAAALPDLFEPFEIDDVIGRG